MIRLVVLVAGLIVLPATVVMAMDSNGFDS